MRDRNLEQNIERLEALIENWKKLSQFLDRGFQQQEFAGEDEGAFLELKSQIAREYEMLMTLLAVGAEREDRALRLLNTANSLQAIKELPEGMDRKIATEWHGTFIAWQALLGRLRGRQAQLATMSTLRVSYRRVFSHPLVVVLLLALAAYGVYRLASEWVPQLTRLLEQLERKP